MFKYRDFNWCTPAQAEMPQFAEAEVRTKDGETRHVWYAAGKKNAPTILYLHGNAYSIATIAFIFGPYVNAGFNVCLPEYRGFGASGGKLSEAGFVLDARAAYEFLRARGHKDIIIHGCSMGTSVASKLAAELEASGEKLGGVILESPFYNLCSMAPNIICKKLLLGNKFKTNEYVRGIKNSPVLLMHGVLDRLVGLEQGARLFPEIASDNKRFHVIGTGTHELFNSGSLEYAAEWIKRNKPR
ncbi:MAG: alpha/beta hydrolase [Proteobacteria bacterium]|nr:alpha/beta hydrolase [Pseudomonadota bacterium]